MRLQLNISLVQITDAEIDIIDIQGKRIFNKMINGRDQIELDVSQLQGGIYFVRVTSQGKTFIKKLVKE